jgi:predicted ATPase
VITELHVQGLKSLRDVRIPLAPGITVFVGANNTGKSAALQALGIVGETLRNGLRPALNRFGANSVLSVPIGKAEFSISVDGSNPHRRFRAWIALDGVMRVSLNNLVNGGFRELNGTDANNLAGQLIGPDIASSAFVRPLSLSMIYDLSAQALRRASPVVERPQLASDGSNIGAVIDAIRNETPDTFDRIEDEVKEAAKEVQRITSPVGASGSGTGKVVGVQEKDGNVYRADVLSDGLLLFIALSTIVQSNADVPTILGFEEPDRGVHPRRIRDVVDQFRRIAAKGTQIVLTTHSPLLLDEFRDSPESVVVFERDENGTKATRLTDKPEWKEQIFSGQSLGELWYSGLLGGIPK